MAAKKKGVKKSSNRASSSQKSAKKRGTTTAKKTAKKGSAAKKPALKPGVFNVSTGKGPSPAEIGADIVAMFNRGELRQIEDKYWAPTVESIEGVGVGQGWRGRDAVVGKNQWWMADHVMHAGSAEGPYVGSTGFAIRFLLDVEAKSTGDRGWMQEVGVYTVKDGKIIREEFMYGPPMPAGRMA